jgi:CRISPR-associated protein Csx17
LDDKALSLFLRACLALNWQKVTHRWDHQWPDIPVTTLGLLHPLAAGLQPGNSHDGLADEPVPALSAEWAARLAAGQVTKVHREAMARLRQAGWIAVDAPPPEATADGTQIAAALVPRCLHPQAVFRLIAFNTNPLV